MLMVEEAQAVWSMMDVKVIIDVKATYVGLQLLYLVQTRPRSILDKPNIQFSSGSLVHLPCSKICLTCSSSTRIHWLNSLHDAMMHGTAAALVLCLLTR